MFWFFLNFPYLLIERFGWFQQYKIQQKVKNNYEEMRKMFIQMMFEHLTIILPACLVVSAVPITRSIVIMDWSALPSFFEALLQVWFLFIHVCLFFSFMFSMKLLFDYVLLCYNVFVMCLLCIVVFQFFGDLNLFAKQKKKKI